MMKKYRYRGKLVYDYELLEKSFPYDKKYRSLIGKCVREFYRNKPVEFINVLEIGCGTGYVTEILLKSDSRINIVAVDIDPFMSETSKSKLKKYVENKRLKLVCKDIFDYMNKVSAKTIDVVASALTLHNFDKNQRRQILGEIYRVLKYGGMFVNMDKYVPDNAKKSAKLLKLQLKRYDMFDSMGRPDLKEEITKHEIEDHRPAFIMKEGESIRQLKDIGFKHVKLIKRRERNALIKCIK